MKRLVASAAIVAIAAIGLLGLAGPASAGNNQGQNGNNQGQDLSNLCLNSGQLFLGDAKLTGELNTLNNLTRYVSTDGTCGGGVDAVFTAVIAPTPQQADRQCQRLGFGFAVNLRNEIPSYLNAPANWWVCGP